MNLDKEFKLAEKLTCSELYPYYVFDKTNYARVSGLQLYIDIFSKPSESCYENWTLLFNLSVRL